MNRYTSPEVMALEGARLWPRAWVLAGPLCDLAAPGDHFVVELGADSILVARDGEGRVAAHHNVCRHRGTPLRPCGPGHAERFTCPYHGWEWGLDGRLLHAPDGGGFYELDDVPEPPWLVRPEDLDRPAVEVDARRRLNVLA